MVKDQLEDFKSSNFIPEPLTGFEQIMDFQIDRYQSSIDWIDQYGHAVISNGPFYLEGYSPDSRSITIKSFDSSGYPLEQGIWKEGLLAFDAVLRSRESGIDVEVQAAVDAMGDVLVTSFDFNKKEYEFSKGGY